MTVSSSEFLEHYGVKGMQWGVRRRRGSDGRVVDNGKASPDAKKAEEVASKLKNKGLKSLSNDEIKSLNQRLELESNLKRLTTDPSKADTFSKGHKFVKDNLVGPVKTVSDVFNLANSPMMKELKKHLKT